MNKFAQVLKRQQVVLNPGPFDRKVRRSATGGFEPRSPRPKVRRCTTRPPRPTPLLLNKCKTEAVVISAAQNRKRVQPPVDLVIDVCGCSVTPKPFIRDIGFVFDDTMTMVAQIRRVCQVAYCHIRGIATTRKCLSTIACKTIIHTLVMSRLDFGNTLFYGLPETQLRKLQMIQNSAARLITGTRRRYHITPVLFSLHWLPVRQRIDFKLLLLVFRAVHHLCPVYLSSLAIPYIHTHPNTEIRRSTSIDYTAVPSRAVRSSGLFCGRTDTVERPASCN